MAIECVSSWQSRQFAVHYRLLIADRRAIRANKAVVRRLVEEVLAQGDLAAVDSLFTPSAVVHDPATATTLRGAGAIRAHLARIWPACSDHAYRIANQVAEGDTVVTTFALRGAPHGRSAPAPDRCATVVGLRIDRLADGMIVESWGDTTIAAIPGDLRRCPTLDTPVNREQTTP